MRVSRESPDVNHNPLKTFQKGAAPGLRDPINFWALQLHANSSILGVSGVTRLVLLFYY